ncbi:acyl-CoA dehydrogenase family protein [Desertimonas flava]|uniref:acyl-CoA dehydrogenase family protein n=1 Tax=Desertimonas flava TaxID=2064846 RepID=UPI0013C4D7EF|nr:acyl-CoA dehydrogenase family protein [Desertimonas flava]
MEALGAVGHPGPLVAAAFAAQVLTGPLHEAATSGAMVGLVVDGLVSWGQRADILIEVDGTNAWLVEADGPLEPFTTLADRPWARGTTRRKVELDNALEGYRYGDLTVAAWVTGAATHLLERGAVHARERRQFGGPIGRFHAVSHPLAAAAAEVGAARDLTRLAAVTEGPEKLGLLAAQARIVASRAAMRAAFAVHQVHGALGFAIESDIARFSAGIRECSVVLPLGLRARVQQPQVER